MKLLLTFFFCGDCLTALLIYMLAVIPGICNVPGLIDFLRTWGAVKSSLALDIIFLKSFMTFELQSFSRGGALYALVGDC